MDLPPDLRLKLQEHIKGRIRPLTVAAFEQTGTDPECAIEELTNRLFALRNIDDIRPLIRALMIPEDESIQLLSAWIGITYFEYEYAIIQINFKYFAKWLSNCSMPRE